MTACCPHLGKSRQVYGAGPLANVTAVPAPFAASVPAVLTEAGIWSVGVMIRANPSQIHTSPPLVLTLDRSDEVIQFMAPSIGGAVFASDLSIVGEFDTRRSFPSRKVEILRRPNTDAGDAAVLVLLTLRVCGCGR